MKNKILQKKIAVILFCLLSAFISMRIIIKTVYLKTPDMILIRRPVVPSHIGKTNPVQPFFYISPEDFERVERIKKNHDSSIIKHRPGLMDSIILFEKIYQSQLKK
jgi:hypothetical protein